MANAVPGEGTRRPVQGAVYLKAYQERRLAKPIDHGHGLALGSSERIDLIAREPMEPRDLVAIDGVGAVMCATTRIIQSSPYGDGTSGPYRA